jgi:opacity protein-like surface antigen
MKSILLATAALSAAVIGSSAIAQTEAADGAASSPWYGAVALGGRPDPASPAAAAPAALSAQPQGWAGYAHIGYHIDPHWRLDLQGGYRTGAAAPASAAGDAAGFCAAAASGPACGPRDRALGAYAAVANLIFEAAPDDRWFDPFFGLGLGFARPDPEAEPSPNPAIRILQMNARQAQIAYQAMVGLSFKPHNRLHIDLTYRWLGAQGPGPIGPPNPFNGRYQDQTLAIGLRYAFSPPLRAIAPTPGFGLALAGLTPRLAPPPPPPRAVVIETPANPADLAMETEAAVRQAALAGDVGFGGRVVVDGHADDGAGYDQRLSERRAKAMADAMVALGVPAADIDLRWDGASAVRPSADPATQQAMVGPAPNR